MKVKFFLVFILILFICTPVFAEEYVSFLDDMVDFIKDYHIVLVVVAWVLALVIGFLVVNGWKKKMNTAHLKTQADAYVIPGSLSFKTKKDSFLYSTVTKIKRQTHSAGGAARRMSGRRR